MKIIMKSCMALLLFLGFLSSVNMGLANRLSIPEPDEAQNSPASRPAHQKPQSEKADAPQEKAPEGPGQAQNESTQEGKAAASAQPQEDSSQPASQADSSADQKSGGEAASAGSDKVSSSEEKGEASDTPASSTADRDSGAEKGQDSGKGDMNMNSLSELGDKRKDIEGEQLRIPENAENPQFMEGLWSFERTFVSPSGEEYKADFYFNNRGNGKAALTDSKGLTYMADAMAQIEGDALRIMTTPFVNAQTGRTFNAQYIQCENDKAGAICMGTDGFGKWEDEGIFSNRAVAGVFGSYTQKESSTQTSTGGQSSTRSESPSRSGSEISEQGHAVDRGMPAAPSGASGPAPGYSEVSGEGAELPQVVMDNSEKAGVSGFDLGGLKGDWRYSKDMTRREDGRSLSLEFHFDDNGKGYSIIRDASGKTWKANANAQLFGKDLIRARTEGYTGGGENGFYPTFMECRKGKPEMICDVSNGWLRMTDGRLVSMSAKKDSATPGLGDILDMETSLAAPSGGNAGSNAQSAPGSSMEDILGGMVDEAMLAQDKGEGKSGGTSRGSSTTAKQGSSDSSSSSGRNSANLQIPSNSRNMNFLQGSWRCNTGLARTSDNQPVVVEFSFNKNGNGSAHIRERNGTVYTASAHANLSRNILRINTSEFYAPRSRSAYNKCFIECRNQGNAAICSGENGGTVWRNATFTRIK